MGHSEPSSITCDSMAPTPTGESSHASFNGGSGSWWVRTISYAMSFFTDAKASSHSADRFHGLPCSKSLFRGLRVVARLGKNLW